MRRIVGIGFAIALLVLGAFSVRSGVFAQDSTPIAEGDTTQVEESASPIADEGQDGLPGAILIRVIERAETDTVVDTGESGDSVGDLLAFGNPVYDEANETQVGTDQGSCVRTVVGEAWECSWTIFLPDGQIVVQGPFFDSEDSTLAITGGTGSYRGARGQMTLQHRNEEGSEFEFTYEVE